MEFNDRRGPLTYGDRVSHPEFGKGTVVGVRGHHDGPLVTVQYGKKDTIGKDHGPDELTKLLTPAQKRDADHRPRQDDDSEPGKDRCKDCGKRITWNGPNHSDWSHS